MRALTEASALHQQKAKPPKIADVLKHAREVLQILEERIAAHPIEFPTDAAAVLAQLRNRLAVLEKNVEAKPHSKPGPTPQ